MDARRHQGLSQCPLAWSVSNLVKNVVAFAAEKAQEQPSGLLKSLQPDEVPTAQWVRLLFCPSNPWLASSAVYKCKFDISSKLMSRSHHHEHADSEYAARVFKHLRSLACELKSMGVSVAMLFADDKCSAKVGEPGDALAATERNKSVLAVSAKAAVASMHDFAKFKINPTAMLLLMLEDIPDTADESFYRGHVSVGVKDAVFQPSTPMRHAAEMLKVLRGVGLVEGRMLPMQGPALQGEAWPLPPWKPPPVQAPLEVLLMYTDGGPDHNVKFITVWLSLITLFLACDLDFLVAARTCPQQSWRNCVEKIMCILNMAMYGVALVRSTMPEEHEKLCKAAGGSMAAVRKAAEGNCEFQEACMAAILPVRALLSKRYAQLDLKGTPFQAYEAASDDEMLDMLTWCVLVDSTLPTDASGLHLKSKHLKTGHPELETWVKLHCSCYEYQVEIGKRCWQWDSTERQWQNGTGCKTCKQPKMAPEKFMKLAARTPLNPLPEPSRAKSEEWAKYAELSMKNSTSEDYRPSLTKPVKRKKGAGWNHLNIHVY